MSEPIVSPALQNLAAARDRLTAVTEKSEVAHAHQNALLVRKTEAETKSAEALRDFREGRINEATSGIRKAAADADVADLNVLIDKGAQALFAINAERETAVSLHAQAQNTAAREENELKARELDMHIKSIEKVLVEAIKERHQAYLALNPRTLQKGSTFNFYDPNEALKRIIVSNEAPSF